MVAIKICGVTRVEDALTCVSAGVESIGINFSRASKRYCDPERAAQIAKAVAGRAMLVGVFVDASYDEIVAARDSVGLGCVQLHGSEPPELLRRLLPHAYKALRVRGPSIVHEVAAYPGDHILLDAFVPGGIGGTGARFDWTLARAVGRERRVTLAGGLTPENVAEAVEIGLPYGVDVASGVERTPGIKDAILVHAFVAAVRRASFPSS